MKKNIIDKVIIASFAFLVVVVVAGFISFKLKQANIQVAVEPGEPTQAANNTSTSAPITKIIDKTVFYSGTSPKSINKKADYCIPNGWCYFKITIPTLDQYSASTARVITNRYGQDNKNMYQDIEFFVNPKDKNIYIPFSTGDSVWPQFNYVVSVSTYE